MKKRTCQECKGYVEIARNSMICEHCRNKLLKQYQKPKQAYQEDTIKGRQITNNTC